MIARADEGARLGSLFGFPIFAHASLIASAPLVFIALFMTGMGSASVFDGFAFVGVVIISLIAHELGHAFAARALGVPVRQISLTWYGGYADFHLLPATRLSEILIAIAGPLVNLMIGAVAFAYLRRFDPYVWTESHTFYEQYTFDEFIRHAVRSVAVVNLSLGAFNLLPGLPLDGGHVLSGLLSLVWSRGRASWIAAWVGYFMGTLVVLGGFMSLNLWTIVIGFSLALAAWNYRRRLVYQ